MDQPKRVYVREDHLLAQVIANLTGTLLDDPLPQLGGDAQQLAQFLCDHHALIIIYNKNSSVVTSDRGMRDAG
ncbi:hypothetical protein [Saccharopolyspora sp. NPDC002376]